MEDEDDICKQKEYLKDGFYKMGLKIRFPLLLFFLTETQLNNQKMFIQSLYCCFVVSIEVIDSLVIMNIL